MVNENDFYKLLNITPNATQEEIREAYKRRALEFHPDKNTNDTTHIFQAIKQAYETLCDEKRRFEYDADFDSKDNNDDDDDDDDEIFSTAKNNQMR
jgi:curved DNA-binding protein CbpA